MPAKAWVGTSGWTYQHWRGCFYPAGLRPTQWLAFYAQHFRTVEINYSFYRLPTRDSFLNWRKQTLPGFRFAVKGSRFLTHLRRLRDPEGPLELLVERAGSLGDKLGPVLFQLPPTWPLDSARLLAFLEALARYPERRFALELRHESWHTPSVYRLLERHGVALCLPVGLGLPLAVRLTAPWTYVRMHHGRDGIGFGDAELGEWADRISGLLGGQGEAYVYFNNDAEAHAPDDARRCRELLRERGLVIA